MSLLVFLPLTKGVLLMSVFFDDVFLLLYKKRYVYSYVSFFENSSYLRAVVLIMIENIQKPFYL